MPLWPSVVTVRTPGDRQVHRVQLAVPHAQQLAAAIQTVPSGDTATDWPGVMGSWSMAGPSLSRPSPSKIPVTLSTCPSGSSRRRPTPLVVHPQGPVRVDAGQVRGPRVGGHRAELALHRRPRVERQPLRRGSGRRGDDCGLARPRGDQLAVRTERRAVEVDQLGLGPRQRQHRTGLAGTEAAGGQAGRGDRRNGRQGLGQRPLGLDHDLQVDGWSACSPPVPVPRPGLRR